MKNITPSADERLIEAARAVAQRKRTTLNAAFRAWLRDFSQGGDNRARRTWPPTGRSIAAWITRGPANDLAAMK
ncbi:MAG TPA: hypothetical protein VN709_08120 [Terriglobales bacterium]|nr:hypothetical protein [Terriglobales bacterium]